MNRLDATLIRTTLDAAEALFEQDPTDFIDKWIEVLERKCSHNVPKKRKNPQKQRKVV